MKRPRTTLRDGQILPSDAVRCVNKFDPPHLRTYRVREPYLPVGEAKRFSSRDAATAAILEHDARQAAA